MFKSSSTCINTDRQRLIFQRLISLALHLAGADQVDAATKLAGVAELVTQFADDCVAEFGGEAWMDEDQATDGSFIEDGDIDTSRPESVNVVGNRFKELVISRLEAEDVRPAEEKGLEHDIACHQQSVPTTAGLELVAQAARVDDAEVSRGHVQTADVATFKEAVMKWIGPHNDTNESLGDTAEELDVPTFKDVVLGWMATQEPDLHAEPILEDQFVRPSLKELVTEWMGEESSTDSGLQDDGSTTSDAGNEGDSSVTTSTFHIAPGNDSSPARETSSMSHCRGQLTKDDEEMGRRLFPFCPPGWLDEVMRRYYAKKQNDRSPITNKDLGPG